MAVAPPRVLPAPLLEDEDLGALGLLEHGGDDAGTGHERVPSCGASPPTISTWSSSTVLPASPSIFSTLITSLGATRYCLPPVLITAYMGWSTWL